MQHDVLGNGVSMSDPRAREQVDIWEALQAPAPSSHASALERIGGNGVAPSAALPTAKSFEEQQLEIQIQRAIELSLKQDKQQQQPNSSVARDAADEDASPLSDSRLPAPAASEPDLDDISKAILLSRQEEEENQRRRREEEEMLAKVLELSMKET